jgi:methyl-accepting chemotaxis protein
MVYCTMKRKLIILLVIFSSVPLIAASVFSLSLFSNDMQEEFRQLSSTRAEMVQAEVKVFINKHMELLKLLAKTPAVRGYDIDSVKPVIAEASKTYPSLVPISVDNDKGKQLVKSDNSKLVDVTDRQFYQMAMQGKEEVVSEVLISKSNGQPIVILATPIRSADGRITGVLQGTIDLSVLVDFVGKKSTAGNLTFILDQEGKVIAHPDKKITTERTDMSQLPFVQKALKDGNGAEDFTDDQGIKSLVSYSRDTQTGWIICQQQSYDGYIAQRNHLIMTNGLLLLATLGLVLAFGFVAAKKAVRPIEQLVKATEAIRSGDLTVSLAIKDKDEIGILAQNFNTMAASLRGLVKQVAGAAEHVASSAQQLTASAEQSAQAVNQIASAIAEVALGAENQVRATGETRTVVDRLSVNIGQVANSSDNAAGVSGKTAAATEQGGKAIESAISQMSSIERTVVDSAKVVENLGQRSQEIGQIVDTIAGIAGQTNLLALNAAIEAARAGEQGRGFAVVAEEVRKLAEQSHEAAKQIAALIEAVQHDTNGAVEAMKKGTGEVKRGTEVVSAAGASFKEIAGLIRQVSDQVAQSSLAVKAMAGDSQKIVEDVRKIDQISRDTSAQSQTVSAATEETTASMEEIAASSQALVRMAEELQVVIQKFKV